MTVHVSIDGAVLNAQHKYLEMDRFTAYRMMLQIGMALSATDTGTREVVEEPEDDDLLPPMGR